MQEVRKAVADECGLAQATFANNKQVDILLCNFGRNLQGCSLMSVPGFGHRINNMTCKTEYHSRLYNICTRSIDRFPDRCLWLGFLLAGAACWGPAAECACSEGAEKDD